MHSGFAWTDSGPLSAQSLAYRRLREAIVSNRLAPGTPLRAASLAADLGVSATPIREALIRLEAEGLVVWRQNRGATVAPLSADEVRHVYDVRSVLEGLAARLTAARADADLLASLAGILERMARHQAAGEYRESIALNRAFHGAIHERCGNPELIATIESFWGRTERFRNLTADLTTHLKDAHLGHEALVQAMRDRDAESAERIARDHVLAARRAVAAHIEAIR